MREFIKSLDSNDLDLLCDVIYKEWKLVIDITWSHIEEYDLKIIYINESQYSQIMDPITKIQYENAIALSYNEPYEPIIYLGLSADDAPQSVWVDLIMDMLEKFNEEKYSREKCQQNLERIMN